MNSPQESSALEFRAGDIAACYGADLTSRFIRLQTGSLISRPRLGPSHVAIIVPSQLSPSKLDYLWCESTTMCRRPCSMQKRWVDGVQLHNPHGRIDDYLQPGGRVDLYRIAPFWQLNMSEMGLLTTTALDCLGLHYDMPGALLSGTRLCSRILQPRECLSSFFCSELLAVMLMRIGLINHSHPRRYNPARLIRELLRTDKYRLVRSYSGAES